MCWRAPDPQFNVHPLPISRFAKKKYRHVRRLFRRSVRILRTTRLSPLDSVKGIKQLITFYERADVFMCLLVNEVFGDDLDGDIDGKQGVFCILDKLLEMFFMFDNDRFRYIQVFHDYAILSVYGYDLQLSENDLLKVAAFSAMSLPMARLFMTYFNTDSMQITQPEVLCRRAPIYLSTERKDRLEAVCRMMGRTRCRYARLFFCALHEKSTGTPHPHIKSLDPELQSYYRAMRTMR